MKNNKKIFVYVNGPHDSHKPLCKIYGIAKKKKIDKYNVLGVFSRFLGFWWQGLQLRGYHFYFFEGSSSAALSPVVKTKKNLLVIKGNDHLPFLMERSTVWRFCFKHLINLNRSVDGMIAVSSMVQKDYRKFFKHLDIVVAEGFMVRNSRELYCIKRNKHRIHHFVSIGANALLKGVDRNIDFFIALKKENIIPRDSKFYIVGIKASTTKELQLDVKMAQDFGVEFIAYTRSIESYLQLATFQLHLARYEPNAVSLMEGMTSGLIPLVSNTTGNKDFIASIDARCVISFPERENNVADLKQWIGELISKPNTLNSLSDAFRKAEAFYNQTTGLKRWQEAYDYFLQKKSF